MAWVDVDLSDISDNELFYELEHNRFFDERDQARLLELIKGCASDKMKFFLSVMNKYSMQELEEIFCEKFDHSVGKDQLPLFKQS